jgi:aspartate 1-decarboxylase
MLRTFLRAKIHRATVSEANLNYVGSLTVPTALMKISGLLPGEQVDVLNINNGARFSTYLITGKKKKHICLNGAAARLGQPGDRIIIAAYALLNEDEIKKHRMTVIMMNEKNEIVQIQEDGPGVPRRKNATRRK